MNPKKIAVVTGASSGIGKNAVERLIKMGFTVVGAARRKKRLEELEFRFKDDFYGIATDLIDPVQIKSLFHSVFKKFGTIDVLINNAGVGYETSICDGDPLRWKEMFDLNVHGLMLCTRYALDKMREKDQGQIVNISSMSAHRVTPGGGVYAATKYAVKAFTEGLRQELSALGSTIRVIGISPGFVETEFYNAYYKDKNSDEIDSLFQDMKALESRDIVDAIEYAISAPKHVGVNDILLRPLEQMS